MSFLLRAPIAPDIATALELRPEARIGLTSMGVVSITGRPVRLRGLGDAMTLLYDGELCLMGGVIVPWPHVGVAWGMVFPRGAASPVVVARYILRFLRDRIAKHELYRLEMVTDVTDTLGEGLVDWLGADKEGLRRRYLPNGNDGTLWAWVKGR